MSRRWTETDIPDQTGRTVLITGANSGLGLRSAEVLAGRGARVLLACRSPERGAAALARVAAVAAGEKPELVRLDLADLASVRAAAAAVRELTGDALDVLMNNAGVMATAHNHTTDGFELQFGTNHLGHGALTWLLMPALRGAPAARVVTLSSITAYGARIRLDDPNGEHRRYNAGAAYGQSKLANQVFGIELDRRLRAAGSSVLSVLAHPGYSATGLVANMAESYRNPLLRGMIGTIGRFGGAVVAQRLEPGALPQLYAATAEDVEGGDYLGPNRLFQTRGTPAKVRTLATARDLRTGSGLWELTARLTDVTPDPS
ncbi:oxidoreductase [Amycolatopsis jiangsuensis]|uniref:NAD(P)-dependent dehydrogenase (Short-subunit alcohol dehydrogenase family) n=1 Tax=Amycolatopsis jiangsuensis TaxID=1181879 RepID=A0A840IRI0_9PSEU|nr:oxidoreductase [Amycolatopsis jiangsuensis]MBB4685181.1 NAD(P)-dependent dehydrogenase (short-subunit alcohol dehydrogenase family) [Amycolatopsis jiangsuensis]